jgi:hypothetical protein
MFVASHSCVLACVITALIPVSATAQSTPTPKLAKSIELHTNAEWRVTAQMQFDHQGRILILYRDKAKLNPFGNWHLTRITDPLSASPHRDEIAFSLPLEPEGLKGFPDAIRTSLLLGSDDSYAFAIVYGDPRFSAAAKLDLQAMKVSAMADITGHLAVPEPFDVNSALDPNGELLTLSDRNEGLLINAYDSQLTLSRTIRFSNVGQNVVLQSFCRVTPEVTLERSTYADRKTYHISQSGVEADPIDAQTCVPSRNRSAAEAGFGTRERRTPTLSVAFQVICRVNPKPNEASSSPELLPHCHSGLELPAISFDHRLLIAECREDIPFGDDEYLPSRHDVQVIDTSTMLPVAHIEISKFSRMTESIFHAENRTILATLKEGETLKLYTVPDLPKH